MANDEILTVKEVAELLKISAKTCYDWTHIEGFPCVKIGNCSRIPRAMLLEWMERQAGKRGD